MSLIAGVLARDATGRINTLAVADFPSPRFNGGTPASDLGFLVIDADVVQASDAFIGGLRYSAAGALRVALSPVAGYAPGGLQVSPNGAAIYSTGQVPASYLAGIPLDAAGGLCLAAPVPPINLSGFDSGFDGGFG